MFKEGLTPVQNDAIQLITRNWLPGMFALGAGTRGLTGLADLVRSNLAQPPKPPDPDVVNIPYLAPKPKKNTNFLDRLGLGKQAAHDLGILGKWPDFLGGEASNNWQNPAMYPSVFLGGAGALWSGHKLMDMLVNRHRKGLQEQEFNDAKGEYERALINQFKPYAPSQIKKVSPTDPVLSKAGSVRLDEATIKCLIEKTAVEDTKINNLAERLDKLADKVATEKQGWDLNPLTWGSPINYIPEEGKAMLMGGMATAMPALALTSGAGTYRFFKDLPKTQYDPVQAQREMLRKQREERGNRRPPPVYAKLTPVDEQGNPLEPVKSWVDDSKSAADQDEINIKAAAFVKEFLGG
jgi:hypothetical protein